MYCSIVQQVQHRFTALAAVLQEEIERGYLRRAMTLCQDTDYIVRINMCDGLHCLAAAVGLELTVATILPEILELMKDEEPLVRVAAVNSLVAGTKTSQCQYELKLVIVQHCKSISPTSYSTAKVSCLAKYRIGSARCLAAGHARSFSTLVWCMSLHSLVLFWF